MGNAMDELPQALTRRLAMCVERLLAGEGGAATVSCLDARSAETLRSLPGPLAVLGWRLTRGAVGPAALILPGAFGLGVSRALSGDTAAPVPAELGAAEKEALGELAHRLAGDVATALGEALGQPLGFEAAAAQWLEQGGAELAVGEDGLALSLALACNGMTGDAWLVVPQAALPRPASRAGTEMALPPLHGSSSRKHGSGMELVLDISLPVTVELGRTRMMIRDILHLAPGSVLELDKLAGEPVDILINEKSIARGEVVVIDENFGVRLTSIVTPSERVVSLR